MERGTAVLVTIIEDGRGWLLVREDGEAEWWISAERMDFGDVARLVARYQDTEARASADRTRMARHSARSRSGRYERVPTREWMAG